MMNHSESLTNIKGKVPLQLRTFYTRCTFLQSLFFSTVYITEGRPRITYCKFSENFENSFITQQAVTFSWTAQLKDRTRKVADDTDI